MVGNNDKDIFRRSQVKAGKGDRLHGPARFLLIHTAIRSALESLHLILYDKAIFSPCDDDEFITEWKISGDCLLKQRMILLNFDELFRIIMS